MASPTKGTTLEDRLHAKSSPVASGCIEWQGYTNERGYGMIRQGAKRVFAHRVSYQSAFGQIETGKCVLHRCDNPRCVNPAHLFTGTRADNNADKTAKGRQAKGRGHGKPGEQSHFAKLSAADVGAIRALSGISQRAIAARYGISQPNVSKIINQKSWSNHGKC
jgi:hypothetical protein